MGRRPEWTLERALEESRDRGFLGPGLLAAQIEHARGFASTLERTPESFLDLGSGGGVPGLVLASVWPDVRATLLDSMVRRARFLEEATTRLGIADRVSVVCARAEEAARRRDMRERFEVVTARSFGPPAVTAECGVGFLVAGGRMVVSEPPEDDAGRWPEQGLAELGLSVWARPMESRRFVVLERSGELDERFPRRVGVPGRRPLWR